MSSKPTAKEAKADLKEEDLLNQKAEVIKKCRHRSKFKLLKFI